MSQGVPQGVPRLVRLQPIHVRDNGNQTLDAKFGHYLLPQVRVIRLTEATNQGMQRSHKQAAAKHIETTHRQWWGEKTAFLNCVGLNLIAVLKLYNSCDGGR